jgi:DNA-directed RNA polymerase subunit M/transcription elongation factor TFIIS
LKACNRTFRSQACFDKHKINILKGTTVCTQKRNCAKCNGLLVPTRKHECIKSFCVNCQKNREFDHLCYMAPLVNELPKSDNVLFVFYDFETTQETKISDSATLHVPNLVCLQEFCSFCEKQADIDTECARCGQRRHD